MVAVTSGASNVVLNVADEPAASVWKKCEPNQSNSPAESRVTKRSRPALEPIVPRLRTTPSIVTSAPASAEYVESDIENCRSTTPTSTVTVSEQLFSVNVSPGVNKTHAR